MQLVCWCVQIVTLKYINVYTHEGRKNEKPWFRRYQQAKEFIICNKRVLGGLKKNKGERGMEVREQRGRTSSYLSLILKKERKSSRDAVAQEERQMERKERTM